MGGGVSTKVYLLNKQLHCIDIVPDRCLPDIFYFRHPLGSIIGRSKIDNYFLMYQHCTIGANIKSENYPILGTGVVMLPNSKILGECNIGDNVIFGANSCIIDCDVPSNSIVVGQYPNHRILGNRYDVQQVFFGKSS